jgi:CPA1 family monovalent cation:H+ antiporter
MESTLIITLIIGFGLFLALTSLLQQFSKKTSFPYTVLLLTIGLIAQIALHFTEPFLLHNLDLDLRIELPTGIIFFLLLPILLFEAAININYHQFRLQFKTITFLATFGLLLSIFIVGFGLSYALGLPLEVALLFGAMISATDPIAVLSLFKTLGTPKRLALLADGESMFNDATAVIVFRIILSLVVGTHVIESSGGDTEPLAEATRQVFGFADIIGGLGQFIYVFAGSILYGLVLSLITAKIIEKVNNDRLVETTLTLALALFSFSSSEHFFGLSGVITCVIAGISLGNLGRTKFSANVVHFIEEFWEYLGFLAVSLVFFFAAYNLNILALLRNPLDIVIVIAIVLMARAISVYLTFFVTNNVHPFKDEPNVPLSWQHVINWGGLRGVIPLVLAFTLPESFAFKQELMTFTFATLLFTLFVNGTTIEWLIVKLKLNLPAKREAILSEENRIFALERAKEQLSQLKTELGGNLLQAEEKKLLKAEQLHKKHLLELAKPEDLIHTLEVESLQIERQTLEDLFHKGYINENVYHIFNAELDLQQDCLEYPEIYKGRGYRDGIYLPPNRSLRKNFLELRSHLVKHFPFLGTVLFFSQDDIIEERFTLLKARVITSTKVLQHLGEFEKYLCRHKVCTQATQEVRLKHENLISRNTKEIEKLKEKYPAIIDKYKSRLVKHLALEK